MQSDGVLILGICGVCGGNLCAGQAVSVCRSCGCHVGVGCCGVFTTDGGEDACSSGCCERLEAYHEHPTLIQMKMTDYFKKGYPVQGRC